jgi:Zn-finger nucleic acid-binding protein
VAAALAEKAGAVRRAWELERDLESATANLERERAAHAEARARLSSAGATPAAPSPADGQLRHRIAELEHALADREEEVRRLLPPETGDLITCPRCGGKMVEFEHLGVTLDRCTACAGLFFDSGELQEVLRREYPEPDTETETMVAVVTEMTGGDDGPKKKGFFRSLFGRKE